MALVILGMKVVMDVLTMVLCGKRDCYLRFKGMEKVRVRAIGFKMRIVNIPWFGGEKVLDRLLKLSLSGDIAASRKLHKERERLGFHRLSPRPPTVPFYQKRKGERNLYYLGSDIASEICFQMFNPFYDILGDEITDNKYYGRSYASPSKEPLCLAWKACDSGSYHQPGI